MPHRTPGLTARERLAARAVHYVGYAAFFGLLYGGVRYGLGRFPDALLFGVLLGSVAKDLYDEYRLRRGRQPLAYAGVEHAPSNLVLLAFLATGVVAPSGAIAGVPAGHWAAGIAAFDLAFDLWQDSRSGAAEPAAEGLTRRRARWSSRR